MEKHFVNYTQALALKELGYVEYSWFGSECSLYKPNGKHTFYMNGIGDNTYISAPLKSQVFEWFREKHSIHGIVSYYGKGQWNIEILDYKGNELIQIEDNTFWSYEEAESACIDKLIELVKGQ
jgi:hypothetical protein